MEIEEAKQKQLETKSKRVDSAETKKSKQSFKDLKNINEDFLKNTELFFTRWEENEKNDEVRIKLIEDFINSPSLRLNLFKRKQEFLICLNQWIESENPLLYEKGVTITSDLIDINIINDAELLALNPIYKAILWLMPKKIKEESSFTMIRQVSALNVICKLDRLNFEWNDKWSNMIKETEGITTVVALLEQNHQPGYKAQAAQLVGMILEHGTLTKELIKHGAKAILQKLATTSNKVLKQNATEALELINENENEIVEEEISDEEGEDESIKGTKIKRKVL